MSNNYTTKMEGVTTRSTTGGTTKNHNNKSSTMSAGTGVGGHRLESFTEAVPLSLSSMAHASLPLEDGVLDGLKQVVQHTLLSCVNYARIVHPPHQWTFRDLTTSPFAWTAVRGVTTSNADGSTNNGPASSGCSTGGNSAAGGNSVGGGGNSGSGNNNATTATTVAIPRDATVPYALQKLNFRHYYARNAWIYLKPALKGDLTCTEELDQMRDWTRKVGILGRISLLFASTEPLTAGEMQGTDMEDMPPTFLYKVVVEYRSLPPTGNQQAVQAEELSMLSFGGSVDDDVKYGALAALYDEHAKYVLEIYSVRGKKYKFDLMDSTLSDGNVPRLPASRDGDPFVKSLCVTVTDHEAYPQQQQQATGSGVAKNNQNTKMKHNDEENEDNNDEEDDDDDDDDEDDDDEDDDLKKYAITRIHLTLEGKPRCTQFDQLPRFDFISNAMQENFLLLHPKPPLHATALPSGHALLMDPAHAGRVYVNGRYVTTWGKDARIGSHGTALFGMDLHSIPFWHGRIVDYETMKVAYAQLWHEILVDARLLSMGIASRLLHRLISGRDPPNLQQQEQQEQQQQNNNNMDGMNNYNMNSNENGNNNMDHYNNHGQKADNDGGNDEDDDDDDEMSDSDDNNNDQGTNEDGSKKKKKKKQKVDVNTDCLESQVLAAPQYDRVGIAAKALATRFGLEFGSYTFPCLAHEVQWVQRMLPGRKPMVVPQRLLNVLRRGGYFNVQQTHDDLWFSESRPPNEGDEREMVFGAVQMLELAGCSDVTPEQVSFVNIPIPGQQQQQQQQGGGSSASASALKSMDVIRTKAVCRYNEMMQQYCVHEKILQAAIKEYIPAQDVPEDEEQMQNVRAFVLGTYLAKEHPDGTLLVRYLLRNKPYASS